MAGRAWTAADDAVVREAYASARNKFERTAAIDQACRRLGRTRPAVLKRAAILDCSRRYKPRPDNLDQQIAEHNREGLPDAEIARRLGVNRHLVSYRRRQLELPDHSLGEWRQEQVRQMTADQLQRAGVSSLAELRAKRYRDWSSERGWPRGLRPRAVLILDALYELGPRTRRQLCADVGVAWRGSRKSLKSNDPEGSYLANLIARGFVGCHKKRAQERNDAGRVVPVDLYFVFSFIKRGEPQTWPKPKPKPKPKP